MVRLMLTAVKIALYAPDKLVVAEHTLSSTLHNFNRIMSMAVDYALVLKDELSEN